MKTIALALALAASGVALFPSASATHESCWWYSPADYPCTPDGPCTHEGGCAGHKVHQDPEAWCDDTPDPAHCRDCYEGNVQTCRECEYRQISCEDFVPDDYDCVLGVQSPCVICKSPLPCQEDEPAEIDPGECASAGCTPDCYNPCAKLPPQFCDGPANIMRIAAWAHVPVLGGIAVCLELMPGIIPWNLQPIYDLLP